VHRIGREKSPARKVRNDPDEGPRVCGSKKVESEPRQLWGFSGGGKPEFERGK